MPPRSSRRSTGATRWCAGAGCAGCCRSFGATSSPWYSRRTRLRSSSTRGTTRRARGVDAKAYEQWAARVIERVPRGCALARPASRSAQAPGRPRRGDLADDCRGRAAPLASGARPHRPSHDLRTARGAASRDRARQVHPGRRPRAGAPGIRSRLRAGQPARRRVVDRHGPQAGAPRHGGARGRDRRGGAQGARGHVAHARRRCRGARVGRAARPAQRRRASRQRSADRGLHRPLALHR